MVLRHAEVLDKEGNLYTDNLQSARQTIEYILKGDGEECLNRTSLSRVSGTWKWRSIPGSFSLKISRA